MKKIGKILVLACAFANVSAAVASDLTRTVLIGIPAALATAHGRGTHDATQLAIDDANQQNIRVQGQRLVFKAFLADDKSDPKMAVLVARSMVAAGVTAVIGHRTTETSLAVAKIYSDANIPMISPAAATRALTQPRYRNVFQAIGNSDSATEHLADALLGPIQAKRIMILDNETTMTREFSEALTKALIVRGVNPVDRQSINPRTSDFSNLIARIKAVTPDVIFYSGIPPQATAFAHRLKQTGDNHKLLITGAGINPEFPASGDSYTDGVWMLGYGLPLDKIPGIKPLQAAYKARFSSQFVQQTLFAYDSVGVLVEAIRQSDSLDGAVISETLHKIKYKGVSRTISFDANGRMQSPLYTLYQVRGGAWKAVKRYP